LYDFLEITAAEEWTFPQNHVSRKGLLIPIGQGANGKQIELNFTACRGHGILAGMTGSGKSQFLLSMIALLSLKYQPEYFTFAIIDFKADASAMQLKELPNFVGALSDLDDESQLNRALVMLDCESKRRQRILNDAKKDGSIAVNEIEYYHQAQRNGKKMESLPYLLVIVDEFVDAKRSDPNFLEKMARIARQGRSRGIYLLLAAQNPSSEVGGQIAANVGYNICFKVRDDSISTAVIGKPVAANIDAKQQGRGYLLTDIDGLVEFQTPYCGAELTRDGKNTTQLEEIVYLLRQRNLELPPRVFEASLPLEIIPTREGLSLLRSDSTHADITIPVGYGDNIYGAKIEPFSIPFSNGNVMVFGNPGTGKTTLLQTILFLGCSIFSPIDLQFVVCAFGDSSLRLFKELPHVRSCISFEDSELLYRLPTRLEREVNKRKASRQKQPTLIVLIDRMETLVQECPEIAEKLAEISQISFKYGVFFVFSSIRHNILASDKRQSIKTWIAFQTDNEPYSNYMPLREVKKPAPIPGRSLSFINGSHTMETQFFAIDRFGISAEENEEKLNKKIRVIANHYGQPLETFDIETIPEPISMKELEDCDSSVLPLGLRWEYNFTPDGYQFNESPFFVVSGYINMDKILSHMAVYAATTNNFKIDAVYYCDPNAREFPRDLLDCRNINLYGESSLKDFFESIRPLYTSTPASSGNIFIFINCLSLCESKMQAAGESKSHYDTFVKELREQSSQLLGKHIHFIISDYAGLLQSNRPPSGIMYAANQYAHGIIVGGTTINRIGAESFYRTEQIPDGLGYLYRSGSSPVLVKLQNHI
jgi:S-DNA-T family DNA segregation ATPase FtsK/SpoIIIE